LDRDSGRIFNGMASALATQLQKRRHTSRLRSCGLSGFFAVMACAGRRKLSWMMGFLSVVYVLLLPRIYCWSSSLRLSCSCKENSRMGSEIHMSAVRRNGKRDKSQELNCSNFAVPRRSSHLLAITCEGEAVIGVQVDHPTNQMR
jgi:hypothetical protein